MHCVKSVCIRSFSDPYFPTFGLNTERYSVSICRYSVRMMENTDQKNCECGHFLSSNIHKIITQKVDKSMSTKDSFLPYVDSNKYQRHQLSVLYAYLTTDFSSSVLHIYCNFYLCNRKW